MIDTITHPSSSSSSSSTTTTLPPNIQSQPKLTKKQKKALAFRDKSSKTKTKNAKDEQEIEMEDLLVSNMEKSNHDYDASSPLQMGDVEDGSAASTSRRSSTTNARSKGTSQNALSSTGESTKETQHLRQQQQQQQKKGSQSQQKRKQLGEVGNKQRGGDHVEENQKATVKKRKRGQLDDRLVELGRDGDEGAAEEEKARHKKRKREEAEPGVDGAEEESEGEEMKDGEGAVKKGKGKDKQRYILFIGNLKYTTSVDTIQAHFSACDPPAEVRLLTPKASTTGKTTTKSKGCAFLEFQNKAALQQALKLHHSMLEGRMINVELTAGGGGKGEKRMEKLRERNKELLGQRKKKADKKGKKDSSLPSRPDKPQRFSATSGIEQTTPERKRTWTVGDTAEDEVHRGGKEHKKAERTRGSRKSKMKDWATGVNAIPVG
ncbi:hypothetical protein AN958_06594 [Leucoagaricus sp. SymC.cos]|nr:hypothetical protein AN958_06594 [Leucoagaricus sp. SymC.cos]